MGLTKENIRFYGVKFLGQNYNWVQSKYLDGKYVEQRTGVVAVPVSCEEYTIDKIIK